MVNQNNNFYSKSNNENEEIPISNKNWKILFLWHGFPRYAYTSILELTKEYTVKVIANKPKVPFNLTKFSDIDIHWAGSNLNIKTIAKIIRYNPEIIFISGLYYPLFAVLSVLFWALGKKLVYLSDNNDYKDGTALKKFMRILYHKFIISKIFSGFLTPGRQGKLYLENFGHVNNIRTGMYGASSKDFYSYKPLNSRNNSIVYIGQFIKRKNIDRLYNIFTKNFSESGWNLILIGNGELVFDSSSCISVHSFGEVDQLRNILNNSKALILPSIDEHWGVVVHEAALCGCVLLLSDAVGAKSDLASAKNSIIFDPLSDDKIVEAITKFMEWRSNDLEIAELESTELASNFGSSIFKERCIEIMNNIKHH